MLIGNCSRGQARWLPAEAGLPYPRRPPPCSERTLDNVIDTGGPLESMRLRRSALLAEDAIKKIQDHLAMTLDIDALRLIEHEQALHEPPRLRWMHPVSRLLVCLGALVSLGGAVYTWIAIPR